MVTKAKAFRLDAEVPYMLEAMRRVHRMEYSK